MSNEIRPGNLEFPGPVNKYTGKDTPSQGGILPPAVRLAGSLGIVASSVLSPVNSPIEVAAVEDKCQDFVSKGFIPHQGDCDPGDTIFGIFLLTDSGATPDMTQRLAEQGYKNLPPEVRNKITIIAEDPKRIGKVRCYFEKGGCEQDDKKAQIDRVNNLLRPIGRAIQESSFLSKSPYDYISTTTAIRESVMPNVYTGSNLFLINPANPDENLLNYVYARAFIHETGHALADIPDNDGEEKDVMHHRSNTLKLSPQHLALVMEKLNLGVQRYAAPSVEAVLLNPATVLADRTMESSSLGLILAVYASVDTTQFFSEITPFNNDGPGAEDIIGGSLAVHTWGETGHRVPPPPEWYGLLPDMTYTWRVRTSHLAVPLTKEDQRWGQREVAPGKFVLVPGAEVTTTFRTPKRDSRNIALQPLPGGQADRQNPTLVWDNGDKDVYYYEVQVSRDPNFNTDPATANAPVYWELRHGGVTNPKNSYTIPTAFPLEKGSIYHWRVRPRIQGDGIPVAWTPAASFSVAENATIKQLYSEELIDKDYGNGIVGPSQAQLDEVNPPPEPIKPSPLARVITREYANGEYGEIFIPEAGAKEVKSSNPPVDVVTGVQYKAFIDSYNNKNRRRLARRAA